MARSLLLWVRVGLSTSSTNPFEALVTRDPVLLRTRECLRDWSQRPLDVCVVGEPGVGKSLVARLVHLGSGAADSSLQVYPAVDPAGVAHPWGTLGRGAGTWVLDALERWPVARQAAVLEALTRAGTEAPRLVVLSRVAAARLLDEGRLLPSLAARWGIREAVLPPLRARPDDLAPIVHAMLRRAGRLDLRLEPEAWQALAHHGWSDNVRELREVIDAALARARGPRLSAAMLSLDPLVPPSLEALGDGTFRALRREVDAWYLRRLLHHTGGNISEAARRAGCSRKVLRERLRRHGLYPPVSAPVVEVDATACAREPVLHRGVMWCAEPRPRRWGRRRRPIASRASRPRLMNPRPVSSLG